MQFPKFLTFNTWAYILDLLAPPHYALTVDQIQEGYTPFIKNLATEDIEFFAWVGSEYSKDIKTMINRAKLLGEYNQISPLIDNLILQIASGIECQNDRSQALINLSAIWPDCITYIPPDPERYRIRGFHLPIIIAKKLSKLLKIQVKQLTYKITTTQSQSELNRENRELNIQDKFLSIATNYSTLLGITNPIIWLIDDITTTGSTLTEVARTIKKQLPNCLIYGIVLSGGIDS